MVNLSVNNIRSKLTKNAELIGGALGWFSEPQMSSLDATINELQALLKDPKHIEPAIAAVTFRAQVLFKELAIPYIVVEATKGMGIPIVSKNAVPIQKAILGYAGGFLLAAFIANLTGKHEASFQERSERDIVNKALAANYNY